MDIPYFMTSFFDIDYEEIRLLNKMLTDSDNSMQNSMFVNNKLDPKYEHNNRMIKHFVDRNKTKINKNIKDLLKCRCRG
jgi:hypothetical protein